MQEEDSNREAPAKLAGSLEVIPIDQVCQVVASSGKTGLLELALEGGPARIWFEEGLVTAAEYAGKTGQPAFNAFCRQKHGTFLFQPGQTAPRKSIRAPVSAMLLDAYRHADEAVTAPAAAPRSESKPIARTEVKPKPPRSDGRDFVLAGGTLYVFKNLINPLEMNFDISCQKLLATGESEVVIDLTAVKGINSQYIGVLATVAGAARRAGRTLIVRSSGVVAETLKNLGFDQLMELEVED